MTPPIVWRHENALGSLPSNAPASVATVHIWDDAYYQMRGYSLKRLVFIYETLCDASIPIIRGPIVPTLASLNAPSILIPFTPDTHLRSIINTLVRTQNATIIHPDPFVTIPMDQPFKRFFHYWHVAKKILHL